MIKKYFYISIELSGEKSVIGNLKAAKEYHKQYGGKIIKVKMVKNILTVDCHD